MAGLFAAQRDAATEQAKLERVATDSGTGEFNLGTFYEPECHQALYLGTAGVDCAYDALLPAGQRFQCFAISVHYQNDNDSH
jgi:hypothetical protein